MISGQWLRFLIESAVLEDMPFGDVTTEALVPTEAKGKAIIIAKGDGIICGLPIAQLTFEMLDGEVQFAAKVQDGDFVTEDTTVAEVEGKLQALLMAERTALNFLQRLSGIATLTRKFVEKVSPYGVRIADTRKTTPTLRALEKSAVRCGGGINHRFSLSDGVLIKENHIRIAGSITEAVQRVKERGHHLLQIEVEAQSLEQVQEALDCGVDAILLDNFGLTQLREAVQLVQRWSRQTSKPYPLLEASGGITLDNVEAVAQTGVDIISVGALTHSAPALDISMEVV